MALSDKEFKSMQQDAAERVREMRRRSQELINGSGGVLAREDKEDFSQMPKAREKSAVRQAGGNQNNTLLKGMEELLSGFKLDEEKALIAMMIYILAKNGADVKLLIALGYLLL